MQSKFNIEYPEELASAIIDKNLPLITESIPSYLNQIEKAVSRGDTISINHRVAGYFGSYFDILYAINRLPHPGEKRLVNTSLKTCKKIPDNFKSSIDECLKSSPSMLVKSLRHLSKELTLLL